VAAVPIGLSLTPLRIIKKYPWALIVKHHAMKTDAEWQYSSTIVNLVSIWNIVAYSLKKPTIHVCADNGNVVEIQIRYTASLSEDQGIITTNYHIIVYW
jgi:hypothetical protein